MMMSNILSSAGLRVGKILSNRQLGTGVLLVIPKDVSNRQLGTGVLLVIPKDAPALLIMG